MIQDFPVLGHSSLSFPFINVRNNSNPNYAPTTEPEHHFWSFSLFFVPTNLILAHGILPISKPLYQLYFWNIQDVYTMRLFLFKIAQHCWTMFLEYLSMQLFSNYVRVCSRTMTNQGAGVNHVSEPGPAMSCDYNECIWDIFTVLADASPCGLSVPTTHFYEYRTKKKLGHVGQQKPYRADGVWTVNMMSLSSKKLLLLDFYSLELWRQKSQICLWNIISDFFNVHTRRAFLLHTNWFEIQIVFHNDIH